MSLQLRRGTAAQWTAANPVLADGQPGYEKDTGKLKFGDGVTAWNSLGYFTATSGTPAASVNPQTGTSYTLVLGDAGGIVTMANAASNTLTIPTNATAAFPLGTKIEVLRTGAGTTTLQAASGVTLNGVSGGSVPIGAAWSSRIIVKTGTNEWAAIGGEVQASGSTKPSNTSAPTLTGTPTSGQGWTATTGAWIGSPTPTLEMDVQWSSTSANPTSDTGWTDYSSALTGTYAADDVNRFFRTRVSASNSAGTTVAYSAVVGPIAAASGDTTAPVVASPSFNDSTKALAFSVNEAGTCHWGLADPSTDPSAADLKTKATGGSVATIYEGGSFAVTTTTGTATINSTTTPSGARELSFFVEDAAGNPGVVQRAAVTVPAADTTAPTLVSSSPADNATGVDVGASPTLTFSENIAFGTGLVTLRQNIGGTWSDLETFDVATEQGTADGQVSITGPTLTINPSAPFVTSREYAIRVAATAIEDASGNAFAGIANDTTLSFTTTSSAFTPASLWGYYPSAVGDWGKASDLSRLWTDTAGTTLVTATGQDPARWDGQRGVVSFRQATAGNRGTYTSDGSGTRVVFNSATTEYMESAAALNLTGTDALTVWVAVRARANEWGGIIGQDNPFGATHSWQIMRNGDTGTGNYDWGVRGSGSIQYLEPTRIAGMAQPHLAVIIAEADISADLQKIWVNGGTATATGVADLGSGNFQSALLHLAIRSTISNAFNGDIYEWGVIGTLLTTSEKNQLLAYLAAVNGATTTTLS